MKVPEINFNTFVVAFVGCLVGVVGYLAKLQLEDVKHSINTTHLLIMPRQEVEAQLMMRKEDMIRQDAQILYIRTKVDALELEMIRLKKP